MKAVTSLVVACGLIIGGCAQVERAAVCTGQPEFDLWLSGIDGDVAQFTDLPGAEAFPDWSPDGDRVAFVASKDGNCELYVQETDGSGLANLTRSEADEMYPSWSPDGAAIVFSSDRQLHVLDLATGEQRQLTDSDLIHGFPDWSPDGGSIVFSGGLEPAGPGAIHDIYLIPAVGGEEVAITKGERLLVAPRWSPDGGRIAYFDHTDKLTMYVMNRDGSSPQSVGPGGHPAWGPDGGRLVHDREVGEGDVDLYLRNVDESTSTVLVAGPGIETTPAWSPDGRMVIFASDGFP